MTHHADTLEWLLRPASLDTGIDLRNKHMREKYLEVQKYPNAVLTVDRSTLHFPDDVATNLLTIDATDPKSGTAEFKATAIRVERIGATAPA